MAKKDKNVVRKKKVKKDKRKRMPGSKPVDIIHYHGSTAVYGRSGTGKTTMSASWPKPILYFNIKDNGTDSIREHGDDIDVKNIETIDDWEDAILWLYAEKGKLPYKSIVVDTMTQLQQLYVNVAMEELLRKNKKKLDPGKRAGDFGTLRQQDWGFVSGMMKKAIEDIRGLPVESVFIAQEKAINNSDDEEDFRDVMQPEVGPRLIKSVAADLNAAVSIIACTFIRAKEIKEEKRGRRIRIKKQYCARVGPNEVYVTKIRKPKGVEAPDFVVDPTHAKLMAIVEGKD